jgi:hypothetical protein
MEVDTEYLDILQLICKSIWYSETSSNHFFFEGLAGASNETSKLKSESQIPARLLSGALACLLGLPVELCEDAFLLNAPKGPIVLLDE